MTLVDNESTASLTDRERSLLLVALQCRNYLRELADRNMLDGDDATSIAMNQRAVRLYQIADDCINSDMDLYQSCYGDGE